MLGHVQNERIPVLPDMLRREVNMTFAHSANTIRENSVGTPYPYHLLISAWRHCQMKYTPQTREKQI